VHILGHRRAELIKILADHYDTNTSCFFNSCVESAILRRWQDMEVIIIIGIIAGVVTIILIILVNGELKFEMAIFDLSILFLEDRSQIIPCFVMS